MKDAVIVMGAGGHAKVVIELLVASGVAVDYCIAGPGSPARCLHVEVLIGDTQLERLHAKGYRLAFPAIGANTVRERVARQTVDAGYVLVNAISPRATVSRSAVLGTGIAIMAGAVVNAAVRIDDIAIINTGATIDHDCQIGAVAHIAPRCALAGSITVGRLAMLGIGTVVAPGVTIGERATIGAGSVVLSDIPSLVVAFGHPARPITKKGTKI